MLQPNVEVLGAVRNRVGESPVWAVAEQALYWVDIEAPAVHRFDWATRVEQRWAVAERVGCIALHAAGGLIAAMETGVFRLELPTGASEARATLVAGVEFPRPGMRFNDGRCDREGRLWVSSMVMDMGQASAAGALWRLDGRGLQQQVPGLITGNGLGFSPDGRTMYLSDSHPQVQRIWAFGLSADGELSDRRDFVDMNPYPGRPDGAAVDAEGGYWICGNDAGEVHRFTPAGALDRSIRLPVSKPSMCAFGGPELAHLFITSITPARPAEGFDASLDGAVFVVQPGVRGLAEVPFTPTI